MRAIDVKSSRKSGKHRTKYLADAAEQGVRLGSNPERSHLRWLRGHETPLVDPAILWRNYSSLDTPIKCSDTDAIRKLAVFPAVSVRPSSVHEHRDDVQFFSQVQKGRFTLRRSHFGLHPQTSSGKGRLRPGQVAGVSVHAMPSTFAGRNSVPSVHMRCNTTAQSQQQQTWLRSSQKFQEASTIHSPRLPNVVQRRRQAILRARRNRAEAIIPFHHPLRSLLTSSTREPRFEFWRLALFFKPGSVWSGWVCIPFPRCSP